MAFGHAAAVPTGRDARAFDPTCDVHKDNLVAVVMHDDDARVWGRRFDIARVTGVKDREGPGAEYEVAYYDCGGFCPGRHTLDSLAFLAQEERQLDGRWKEGTQTGVVHSDHILCKTWLCKGGARKGHFYPGYRESLEAALQQYDEPLD